MGWTKVEDSLPGAGLAEIDRVGIKSGVVLAIRKNSGQGAEVISIKYFMKNTDEFTHWYYIPPMSEQEPPLTQGELRKLRRTIL